MMHGRAARLIAIGVLVLAALVLVKPFSTTYTDVRGGDFVVHRAASCGAPIASVFGTDPSFEGPSPSAFGVSDAGDRCRRDAGVRVASGLALMLTVGVASLITILISRRRPREAVPVRT